MPTRSSQSGCALGAEVAQVKRGVQPMPPFHERPAGLARGKGDERVQKHVLVGLALAVLGACSTISESRFNPFNWFGASEPAEARAQAGPIEVPPLVPPGRTVETVDARALIETVDALTVAPVRGGALVQASGTAATLGAFNAELVPVSRADGTLRLAFRVAYPREAISVGSPSQRRVNAAVVLAPDDLRGLRWIEVFGATSARVSRR